VPSADAQLMQRRKDMLHANLEVRALYSITLLARLANVTRQLLRRLHQSSGVQLVHIGRTALVPMSEIEKRIPLLWESLCSVERAGGRGEEVAPLRKNRASTR
jgi:hypothetical protein